MLILLFFFVGHVDRGDDLVGDVPCGGHRVGRVENCRERHDQRSCKIFASCVNFPGKQHNLYHNLRRTARFTHTKCDFALQLLKFYTLSSILTKTLLK